MNIFALMRNVVCMSPRALDNNEISPFLEILDSFRSFFYLLNYFSVTSLHPASFAQVAGNGSRIFIASLYQCLKTSPYKELSRSSLALLQLYLPALRTVDLENRCIDMLCLSWHL